MPLRKPEPTDHEPINIRVIDLDALAEQERQDRKRWGMENTSIEERQSLVLENRKLVTGLVQAAMERYRLPENLREELVAAGNLALVQAADRFEPDRGVEFMTFATKRVFGEIIDSLRARETSNEVAQKSLDGFVSEEANPERQAIITQELRRVQEVVQELGTRERALFEAHYGKGLSLREAGDEQGISRSYASRLHDHTIETIRSQHDFEDEMEEEQERGR